MKYRVDLYLDPKIVTVDSESQLRDAIRALSPKLGRKLDVFICSEYSGGKEKFHGKYIIGADSAYRIEDTERK